MGPLGNIGFSLPEGHNVTINLFPKLLPLQVTSKDEEPLISPTDSERAEALLAFMDKLSGKR